MRRSITGGLGRRHHRALGRDPVNVKTRNGRDVCGGSTTVGGKELHRHHFGYTDCSSR